MKLLIIEDDQVLANTLVRRLAKHDFCCYHADNVSDALLLAHRHMPDYVLLDMKLDAESGLALIKPLRQLLKQSRIILLTGFASIATAVDAIKLGADDYLAKPADTHTLLAALLNRKASSLPEPLPDTMQEQPLTAEQVQWQHLQQVLKFNDGNISATARQLSMHRRTLQRRLQKRPSLVK